MNLVVTGKAPGEITRQQRHWAWSLVLGLGFFILYTVTAAPSIVELYDDSLEFQLVGPTFGIAHPTGYPLYVILGGLWSRVLLPVGNWAWRMNLFSAWAAATTVSLLFLVTQRLIQNSRQRATIWPGLAAALAFGLSPVWWSQATIAEVYALHNLFVVAILLVAWQITMAPARASLVTLLCLLFGLGLTHHRTIVLLVPGVAIMLWGQPSVWRPSWRWVGWSMALLGPLLLYLYIPARAAMGVHDLNHSYVNSWQGFWDHVLARGYTGFFEQNALTIQRTWLAWWGLWQTQLGGVGLGLGLLGIGWLAWQARPRAQWMGLLIVLLTNLLFTLNYQVGDQEVFLLPAWLCFALCIGSGIAALERVLARWPIAKHTVAALGCLILIGGVGGRGPLVNRSQEWAVHDYAVALADVDFPPQSRVIALEGQATALTYMQAAEGWAQHAQPVIADTPAARQAAVDTAVAQGYPTYITQEIEGIAERYSFSGEGPLVRVWPRGTAQVAAPSVVLDQDFADSTLTLTGYDLERLDEAGGTTLRVALYWRPTAVLACVYKLSLRLVDSSGAIVAWPDGQPVVEDRYPLRLAAPTTSWLPGETIRDVHYIPVPAAAIAPDTHLRMILYDGESIAETGVVDLPIAP